MNKVEEIDDKIRALQEETKKVNKKKLTKPLFFLAVVVILISAIIVFFVNYNKKIETTRNQEQEKTLIKAMKILPEENIALTKENNFLKDNLARTLTLQKDWFVIDENTISSEKNGKSIIICLPEKLQKIDYSKYGLQNPEFGVKIRFEEYFSDDDIGNRLLGDRVIYNYMY